MLVCRFFESTSAPEPKDEIMWRRWLETGFYFNPDPVGSGASGSTQGAASQQAPAVTSGSSSGSAGGSQAPASAAPSSPTPTQQVGSGATGAATSPAAPTPAPQWESIRDYAR